MSESNKSKPLSFVPTLSQLESFVTVMSQKQYKRLELIAQGKEETSSFTEKEVRALVKKLQKLRNQK